MSKPGYEQTGVAMTCRSLAEYERMFALEAELLREGEILDVAAGASSFTADANSLGYRALALDPLYGMDRETIFQRGQTEIETSTAKLAKLKDHFDWSYYGTLESHRSGRIAALERFIADFGADGSKERYVAGMLPELPFEDDRFRLVLCSHFLFLYHEQFDYAFHRDAMLELLRVCAPGGEVRVYPVFSLKWAEYPYLDRLLVDLRMGGADIAFEKSQLPFIPGSEKWLCAKKLKAC